MLFNKVNTSFFKGVNRFKVGLKYLPQPDYLDFSLPTSHVVLLTNDGSELTHQVISILEEKGNQVVVLNLIGINNPIKRNSHTLIDSSDKSISSAIDKIHEEYGEIGCFIHLHPHFEFVKPNFSQHFPAEKEIMKTLFLIAKYVKGDLNKLGIHQRASFITCTRMDGKLGQGQRENTSVVGGGITGLVKSLNLEWPQVYCRAVDMEPELSSEQIANQLLAEFHDADVSVIEVGFSKEGRKTTAVTQSNLIENQIIETKVTKDSVFLVSGGAKGVTATCVIEMAKKFQCKFILLGRSTIDFEIPEFAVNEHDERVLMTLIMNDLKEKGEKPNLSKVKTIYKQISAKKEIDKTISAIQNNQSEVIYVEGDVTDFKSFKTALSLATEKLGNITGIIHGAGRLADKYIQDKTENDFKNVLSVKLDGLLSLLSAVKIDQLNHLILFSSVAGFYGNLGQTDYAIANEILSKAAHLFKVNHPEIKVSAINWGAWDSGMVSGELKEQFEAMGISLVDSEGGAALFINEFNNEYNSQPQVIIGGTLPKATSYLGELKIHRIHRHLKLENNPFLNHHKIQGKPVLPLVNAGGWMCQSCEDLYPDYSVFKIENAVLFKGIVFDEKNKENYTLELKELEKNEEKIVFGVTIFSEGTRLPVNHYRSKVTLLNKKIIPSLPKFKHTISNSYEATEGQVLYEDGSLFHAPYFQGVNKILDCTKDQIVLSCIAKEVPLSEQGQFPVKRLNTFFADIQYQGLLIWVQKNYDGAKSLPIKTESAFLYKAIPFGKELFVSVKIKEATNSKLEAECTVYDHDGIVYLQTLGAIVTISKQLVW